VLVACLNTINSKYQLASWTLISCSATLIHDLDTGIQHLHYNVDLLATPMSAYFI